MTKDKAIEHYGSALALSKALGIAHQAVALWKDYPPKEQQMRIHKASGGKLKAEPAVLKFYRELTVGVL